MMPGDPVKWVSVLVGKCIRRGGSGVEWGGDACIAPVTPLFLVEVPLNVNYVIAML